MSSGLFVEDEDEDRYKPSTSTIKEEDEEMSSFEDQLQQGASSSSSSSRDNANIQFGEEDEDPIVETIPLLMNYVPSTETQSVHLLQFPGRSKTRSLLREELVSATIKPKSHLLDIKLPMNSDKFFDQSKVDDWGPSIEFQSLSGVLDPNDTGIYAGKIINDGINKKIVLFNIDSSVQLRTSFKYLDDLDKSSLQMKKPAQQDSPVDTQAVEVLQSAAKTSAFGQDSNRTSLSESLRSARNCDEEQWQHLTWKMGNNSALQSLKQQLQDDADGIKLKTATTPSEFIDRSFY
ncbi:hypothetical protein KGF56_002116 [Candida oxycetoniae]|uniref:Uncharacterized protein n=1 Tax=Candida oxycetoniae TaxID=497107 RepID=A0AAI9SYD6_9ASCO|nr:uncharacterized protein KGF56_002116 [Candida oxycetoniae]KAI3405160.2 hypothetical protein KGF56_002116 [Candida oxycetoniae]